MFGLFKRKSKKDKLQDKYMKLMAEYHRLSILDRAKADKVYVEANEVYEEMNNL